MRIFNQGTHHHCTMSSFISQSSLIEFHGFINLFIVEINQLYYRKCEAPCASNGPYMCGSSFSSSELFNILDNYWVYKHNVYYSQDGNTEAYYQNTHSLDFCTYSIFNNFIFYIYNYGLFVSHLSVLATYYLYHNGLFSHEF